MVNRHRGEVPFQLGGERLSLRLTLGGLAELEDALGVADLSALAERLGAGRIAMRDLFAIICIGLAGAGHEREPDELSRLAAADGLVPMIAAVAELFAATFGDEPTGAPPPHP